MMRLELPKPVLSSFILVHVSSIAPPRTGDEVACQFLVEANAVYMLIQRFICPHGFSSLL